MQKLIDEQVKNYVEYGKFIESQHKLCRAKTSIDDQMNAIAEQRKQLQSPTKSIDDQKNNYINNLNDFRNLLQQKFTIENIQEKFQKYYHYDQHLYFDDKQNESEEKQIQSSLYKFEKLVDKMVQEHMNNKNLNKDEKQQINNNQDIMQQINFGQQMRMLQDNMLPKEVNKIQNLNQNINFQSSHSMYDLNDPFKHHQIQPNFESIDDPFFSPSKADIQKNDYLEQIEVENKNPIVDVQEKETQKKNLNVEPNTFKELLQLKNADFGLNEQGEQQSLQQIFQRELQQQILNEFIIGDNCQIQTIKQEINQNKKINQLLHK